MRYNIRLACGRVSSQALNAIQLTLGPTPESFNPFRVSRFKNNGLKVLYNPQLRKKAKGDPELLTRPSQSGAIS
jgi:hypothetical protein